MLALAAFLRHRLSEVGDTLAPRQMHATSPLSEPEADQAAAHVGAAQ